MVLEGKMTLPKKSSDYYDYFVGAVLSIPILYYFFSHLIPTLIIGYILGFISGVLAICYLIGASIIDIVSRKSFGQTCSLIVKKLTKKDEDTVEIPISLIREETRKAGEKVQSEIYTANKTGREPETGYESAKPQTSFVDYKELNEDQKAFLNSKTTWQSPPEAFVNKEGEDPSVVSPVRAKDCGCRFTEVDRKFYEKTGNKYYCVHGNPRIFIADN